MASEHFDVIVVGAGSGGGILAPRLTDDPARRVLLLEAGPDFPDDLALLPAFYSGGHQLQHMFVGEFDWGYASEPLPPENGGRSIRLPRGKLVGGSSMANAQMFIRPAPFDLDRRWTAAGAPSWTWDAFRPSIEAVEREIAWKTYPRPGWQPVQHAFHEAMLGLGYRDHARINAPDAWHGIVGPTPFNRINEVRQGTLVTTIRRARDRENLVIRADTLVDRVVLEHGRAVGVRAIGPDGIAYEARADQVVLCAGAYATPGILMRSGIGPAAHLREHDIAVACDLPVGERLLDHAALFWYFHNAELAEVRGPGASVLARHHDNDWLGVATTLDEGAGLCGFAFVTTTDNVGGPVRLRSADPTATLSISHRYDIDGHRSAWVLVRELLELPQFRGSRFVDAGRPFEEIVEERIGTSYHPAGTCAIGRVVDEELRVLGVEALMVADASVFPAQISNNTNLTCLAIGESAARRLGAAPRPVA